MRKRRVIQIKKELKNYEKIIQLLIGSILIFIGIILLWLQTYNNSISAIFVTGILFIILGSYDIISFFFNLQQKFKENKKIVVESESETQFEVKKFQIKKESIEKKIIICSLCSETYPYDTIHNYCIVCGTQLKT